MATKKITIEEAITNDEFEQFDEAFLPTLKTKYADFLSNRLHLDHVEQRLEDMDTEGIDIQVLSLTAPGIQSVADPKEAVTAAANVNDQLAAMVGSHPDRFKMMAALPWISPVDAVAELDRAVTELGAVGVMLNGHTRGIYMDAKAYWPIWERAESLGVAVYLHPIQAAQQWTNTEGYPELDQAAWGWAFETGTHFWRLVLSGLFDRYPALSVILGHMGEFVPNSSWRFDDRYEWIEKDRGLEHVPSFYVKRNLYVTTSGVCDDGALLAAVAAIGADHVLFAVDYPYQFQDQAVDWIESAPISEVDRELICHGNAERLLGI